MIGIIEIILGVPAWLLFFGTPLVAVIWMIVRVLNRSSCWQGFVAITCWALLSVPLVSVVGGAMGGHSGGADLMTIVVFAGVTLGYGAILWALLSKLGAKSPEPSGAVWKVGARVGDWFLKDDATYETARKRLTERNP